MLEKKISGNLITADEPNVSQPVRQHGELSFGSNSMVVGFLPGAAKMLSPVFSHRISFYVPYFDIQRIDKWAIYGCIISLETFSMDALGDYFDCVFISIYNRNCRRPLPGPRHTSECRSPLRRGFLS